MSDMEGKMTRVGASERGQRTSFKTPGYRGKAKVDLQNQFIGVFCGVQRQVRLEQSMHCSQGFFAGKNRTFFKTVDVLPSKLPRPVKQQWKLSTICDSSHGRLFVCHYIAENSLL
ncbi:MAG: hypothetical protein DME93_10245 [Verrucomicrobia bacterium]|nr:MAG: hypothetical protein DME93_10245 [Verrucomicrobiota bacterium]